MAENLQATLENLIAGLFLHQALLDNYNDTGKFEVPLLEAIKIARQLGFECNIFEFIEVLFNNTTYRLNEHSNVELALF